MPYTTSTPAKQTVDEYLKQYGGQDTLLSKTCDPTCSKITDPQQRDACYKTCIDNYGPRLGMPPLSE
ncbi:predicted protein [Lichtheimia corymbifera JMRC:FSU:9682]|uniref:Uncharacterized protein n=1 Tax=Lichtheimia corymbifera JMRC:FSU:9682 TaxID=1263082 RepID=A0A068RXU6_9FUNG|nr:predicted protein [Lichtheimia corymbifera JMRC:FSU:9682]